VQDGLLVKWYPCHGETKLAKLRQYWGNWKLVVDLYCVQPLPLIQEYFSSRVAFVFAWNGLYAKLLLALMPFSLVFIAADYISENFSSSSDIWATGTVLGFSIIVAYWAKFAENMWQQEEGYLRTLWGLEDVGQDAAVRPDFEGENVEAAIDTKMKIKEYPFWKFELRLCASWSVTLLFCLAVFGFTLAWLDQFSGKISVLGSIVLAIMIQVFTFIYGNLVEQLTIMENHKFQRTYYESYLRKTFVFEFINQYSAFFYMAIKQQFTPQGCPLNIQGEKDCMLALKKQLPVTFLILMTVEIIQVVIANMRVMFLMDWDIYEEEKIRTGSSSKALHYVMHGRDELDEDVMQSPEPTHNFVEKQGKFGPYRTREQIETMTRLTLNIGFVLIFGGIVPIIIPLCLLSFLVQLRSKAVLLTTAIDRPVPRRTRGIGPWLGIIELLMEVSIVFTAYVLVNFGPLFQGMELLPKVSGFILYLLLVRMLWAMHDIISPAKTEEGEMLSQRREHIVSQLLKKEAETKKHGLTEEEKAEQARHAHKVRGFTRFADEAIQGDFDKIPPIHKMSVETARDMGIM
jgi:hypothetical protein